MKCAVLGNGPSRSAYVSRDGYDLVIGCNIPWTEVDSTVVIDTQVVLKWSKNPDLIRCPVNFIRATWMYTDGVKFRKHILDNNQFLSLEPTYKDYSSGHYAAARALGLGYKYLDLYGIDSWFDNVLESYTRKFIEGDPPVTKIQIWRQHWKDLAAKYPDATLNFIKG